MRILYMGTGEIGLPTLETLIEMNDLVGIVTSPDRPAGRGQKMRRGPIAQKALDADIPLFQPTSLKNPDTLATLAEARPDVAVVFAYGKILPRTILNLPRRASLNIHTSLLPRHRGASPIQAALLAGDTHTGITIIYMEEKLDAGDILLQESTAIALDETAGQLHDRLGQLAPATITRSLELLDQGQAPRHPQESSQATYCPKITREAGRIDWTTPAADIERAVRAYHPWPGSYTFYRDLKGVQKRLKIHPPVRALPGSPASPGTILQLDSSGLRVATGEGDLLLTTLQREGRSPHPAFQFRDQIERNHPLSH